MDKIEQEQVPVSTQKEDRNEVNNPYGTFQPPVTPLKHSGPGIASFVIGILALLAYITILALAPAAADEILADPDPEALLENMYVLVIGSLFLIAVLLNLIGVILAIIGLALKNRKKMFSVIGMILNGIVILIVIGFLALL